MERYADAPMDHADATLVAAAEALDTATAFTLDRRGFTTYRLPRGKRFTVNPPPATR
jgi:predicted nucleic acid-binding protein